MNAYTEQGLRKKIVNGCCDNAKKKKKKKAGRYTSGSPNFLLFSSKLPKLLRLRIVFNIIPSKGLSVSIGKGIHFGQKTT